LTSFIQNRGLQKAQIEQQLSAKRQDLIKIYDEAKNIVDKMREHAEKGEVATFETQWKKEQTDIQRKIDQARSMAEG
jgi:hypothetical protein